MLKSIIYLFVAGALFPIVCFSVQDSYTVAPNTSLEITEWGYCATVENDTHLNTVAGEARITAIATSKTPALIRSTNIFPAAFQASPFVGTGRTVFIPTKTKLEWDSAAGQSGPGLISYLCCGKTCS